MAKPRPEYYKKIMLWELCKLNQREERRLDEVIGDLEIAYGELTSRKGLLDVFVRNRSAGSDNNVICIEMYFGSIGADTRFSKKITKLGIEDEIKKYVTNSVLSGLFRDYDYKPPKGLREVSGPVDSPHNFTAQFPGEDPIVCKFAKQVFARVLRHIEISDVINAVDKLNLNILSNKNNCRGLFRIGNLHNYRYVQAPTGVLDMIKILQKISIYCKLRLQGEYFYRNQCDNKSQQWNDHRLPV